MKRLILVSALGAMATFDASATLVTFDESFEWNEIPSGYHGLNWNNFSLQDGTRVNEDDPPASGYQAGLVSPNNVVYNFSYDGGPTAIVSGSAFDLNSAYFTAAWRDNLELSVIGYVGGVAQPQYTHTYTLSATVPTLILFDYLGVDKVEFFSAGGTKHEGYSGDGTHFAMDNMTINAVPEPGTYLAGLGALGMLSVLGWRRRQ